MAIGGIGRNQNLQRLTLMPFDLILGAIVGAIVLIYLLAALAQPEKY